MKPSDIASSLQLLAQIQKPAFLWGPPGVGKSQVVAQVATALGIRLIDIRAILLDPVDLRGLPTLEQGRAAWAIPAFLPEDGAGILFLDELNAAPPLVQAACYQLVLDRALGEYRLPDGWTVFAAGNREGDRAVTSRMSSALANRFVHLNFEADLDAWSRWAMGPGDLRPEVVAFLRWRPELLHRFEPTEKAFPSPRAWASVSHILTATPPADIEFGLYEGTVGRGAAIEFTGFLRVFRSLPSLDGILLNPATAPIPDEPSALCAVATGLARRTTEQNFAAVIHYADRLAREYGTLLVKAATARLPGLAHHPAFTRWAVNNGSALA
jgi:dynein-related subfamily AAA family protein